MSALKGRIGRVEKLAGRDDDTGVLTVLLTTTPGVRREHRRPDGSRVLELSGVVDFDSSAAGRSKVELPRGQFKLYAGFDPLDVV